MKTVKWMVALLMMAVAHTAGAQAYPAKPVRIMVGYGICTQSKVPQPILSKLNTDLNKLLAGPLKQRLENQGIAVTPTTPDGFAAHVKSEIAKWTKVVQQGKLEAE